MDYDSLIIVGIALLFSAFFSGIEIAFVASDKLQIALQSKKGKLSGKILGKFIKNPSFFIGTTLVGNTVALVVYGIYITNFLEPVLFDLLPPILQRDTLFFVIQTIFSTLIVLITAEFIPKSFFLLNPNTSLNIFVIPMQLIYWLMHPVVWLVVSLSKFTITKIFRIKYSENEPVFQLTDLNDFINENISRTSDENIVELDAKIFTNALEFKTVRVRECLIPRTEITAVDIDSSMKELRDTFIESGHSKILVYRDSIDDIVGYCHALELFKKPKNIADILTPIVIAPEATLANELLIQLLTERKSLALIVDEFGGTSGVVSIEDIVEEIFGEIQDEHDDEALIEQQIDHKNLLLSARHEVEYLNEKYEWRIPEGEYDTLGGYIISITEDIPKINDIVETETFRFKIISMEDTRIDIVQMTLKA